MNGTQINLTEAWDAKRDRYAKNVGAFVLSDTVTMVGDDAEVWAMVRAWGGRIFRVIYVCQDGTVRDMIGRQGVHDSAQDGKVQGVGHPMACAERLNLSFWTHIGCKPITPEERAYLAVWFPAHLRAHDRAMAQNKVNTGAGYGYRTLRAGAILALRCEGNDILTEAGASCL